MKYFTVGPSQLHKNYPAYMQAALEMEIGSINHRGSQFIQLHDELSRNIKKLLGVPENYHLFFNGCATEWMERIIQNTSQKTTLHLVCGAFSNKFYSIAKQLGRDAYKIDVQADYSFSPDQLPSDFKPELVCLTHNETSSGVVLPEHFIQAIKAKYPTSLLALDVVSSAPTTEIHLPNIDLVFLSVQKGMGLPAGLGLLVVSPQAMEKAKALEANGQYTGSHHSFRELELYEAKHQTPETPNVVNMYLLNEVCKDYLSVGAEELKGVMRQKAQMLYAAIAKSDQLSLVVQNSDFQSPTVIVARVKNGSGEFLSHMQTKGFVVGAGYGDKKDQEIRIGNFPAHTIEDVKNLVENF